jgi:hypothetical protein
MAQAATDFGAERSFEDTLLARMRFVEARAR